MNIMWHATPRQTVNMGEVSDDIGVVPLLETIKEVMRKPMMEKLARRNTERKKRGEPALRPRDITLDVDVSPIFGWTVTACTEDGEKLFVARGWMDNQQN